MQTEDDSSAADESARIAGLESQILNSQEVIVRLNRELDSALLRITTLEMVCSDNQNDLHEKRARIQQLNDELIEREENNDRLSQELREKDELVRQLSPEDQLQATFDRELRQLLVDELGESPDTPDALLAQLQSHERDKFQRLLQKSLSTEDISQLIDSDDVLFELLTHLNSLSRLKETLSRDSKQLQQLRSALRLPNEYEEELIQDLITKRECMEYLRTKLPDAHDSSDFDLIKSVLHDHFNYQQQQIELNEYLDIAEQSTNDVNLCRMLIERCDEAAHTNAALIEQLRQKETETSAINSESSEVLSPASNLESQLDELRAVLQSNTDFQQSLLSEMSVTSIDEILPRIREYQVMTDNQASTDELTELATLLSTGDEHELGSFGRIRSSLQSLIDLRDALAQKLSVAADPHSILHRLDDYQRVFHHLNSAAHPWTNSTSAELIAKLRTLETAANQVDDLRRQLEEAVDNEKQLQSDIEEIAEEFSPGTLDERTSNLTRIHRVLQALADLRERISSKTRMNTDEDILRAIPPNRETREIESQTVDEEDRPTHVDTSVLDALTQLKEDYELLRTKEENTTRSIERLVAKFDLPTDSPSYTQIDELCQIIDTLRAEYCQLTSADITETSFMAVLDRARLALGEDVQLKELIDRFQPDDDSDALSKLQTHLQKIDALCQLIGDDHINLDHALALYEEKTQHDRDAIKKMATFQQQLFARLSLPDETGVLSRIDELLRSNADLKTKVQSIDHSASTIADQRNKIVEHEDTLEKLRAQRERMLTKMKEMKSNNELLTSQLTQAQRSLDEQHRLAVDYKNRIEELELQQRSAASQLQVTLDECRTQQDMQETMKLELASVQEENETQRKLYESRCRQIINEKQRLQKSKTELADQKQQLENDNKRLQSILTTIRETLDNVDDVDAIVDAILQLQQDSLSATSALHQRDEQLANEQAKLTLSAEQQQNALQECIRVRNDLDRRLSDLEQQLKRLRQELAETNEQYRQLQEEYQSYKESNPEGHNTTATVVTTERSPTPPPTATQTHAVPTQQAASTNHWTSIDMQDEDIPSTASGVGHPFLSPPVEHTASNTPAALLNLLGELKSKLGITFTHRPRSSSGFFVYLCAVHLLTIYLLFIRHC